MTNYARMSVTDLLLELEVAGRNPSLDLIKACMARRIEIRKPLLELFSRVLAAEQRGDYEEDDPRGYCVVHAGLLLIALRERAALPYLASIYTDNAMQWLVEWFEETPAYYGPTAIPTFLEVVHDLQAEEWHYGRSMSAEVLQQIGLQHPAARRQVIEGLRPLLPPLDPDGELSWEEGDLIDAGWADIAGVLGALGDQESVETIVAMFEEGLIDTDNLDYDAYLAMVDGQAGEPHHRFDILRFYETIPPVQ